MGNRIRFALGIGLAALCVWGLVPASAQAARKEAPANKNVQSAEPALFAILRPGASVTYRVTLKNNRRFVEANGDGLQITVTGGATVEETRRISESVYEADIVSDDGEAGNADIRINFTAKTGKLKFVRAGVSFGGNEVVTIDTDDRTIVRRVGVGANPLGIVVAGNPIAGTGRAFVCNSAANTVSVVDVATNQVLRTIAVGTEPRYAIVTGPAGNEFVYVTNFGSDNVTRIDAEDMVVVGSPIPTGDGPVGIAYTGLSSIPQFAYVANQNADTVTVINLQNNTVSTTLTVGDGPTGVSVAGVQGAQVVVVTEQNANNAKLINANNNTLLANIAVGSRPVFSAVAGINFDRIYVCNNGSGTLSLINLDSRRVDATITVGSGPMGAITVGPTNSQEIYVANNNDGTVSVVDTDSRRTVASIFVGGRPRAEAIVGSIPTQRVLVTN